jgi:GTP-binding protein Era
MSHKAGFVNIIGNPNVGKSTLMNAFVGERLFIIHPKHKQHAIESLGL